MTVLKPDFDMAQPVTASTGEMTGTALVLHRDIVCEGELTDGARLYLRHVENGESIRSIARTEGCHPSTILRRIRRFEARRDDPLVDNALRQLGHDGLRKRNLHDSEEQTRRILRRLAESGAELVVAASMDRAIITRGDIRTMVLERSEAEQLALRNWISPIAQGKKMSRYRISAAGRAALRSLGKADGGLPRARDFSDAKPVDGQGMAEGAATFDHADRHRVWQDRTLSDPDDNTPRRMRVNIAESPLLLLARRRDAKGNAFLDPRLVAAGEQLREDFELAQMGPRITQNWQRFMTAGIDSGTFGASSSGGSDSARNRVAEALRELGPGMGDLVLRVCCYLEGLEMTERRLGWSARSGKVVLKLALERLARHYEGRYGPGGPMIG